MGENRRRRLSIRRLVSDPIRCRNVLYQRQARYDRLRELDAPAIIIAREYSMLHDAEYAMSLIEGYYDPHSEINQRVWRHVRTLGFETSGEIMVAQTRPAILEAFRPICVKWGIPQEYGAVIRLIRKLGLGGPDDASAPHAP